MIMLCGMEPIYRWEYYYDKVGDITFTSMDYDEWSYTYSHRTLNII